MNSKPLKVILAEHPGPDKPVVVRVTAELSDYFIAGVDRDHDLSLRVRDDTDSEVFFMARSRVVAATGKTLTLENADRLKSLLGDGKPHKVTVELAYLERDDADMPFVEWFSQEGWRSMSDSETTAQQKLKATAFDAWLSPRKGRRGQAEAVLRSVA